jgi:hypothetical protein
LHGAQGIGKGLLVNELIGKRIYGADNHKQVGDINLLVGTFNSSTTAKLLVNVDEATRLWLPRLSTLGFSFIRTRAARAPMYSPRIHPAATSNGGAGKA